MSSKPCRDCGKAIFFQLTENRKWMAIDQNPDPEGNVIIVGGAAVAFRDGLTAQAKLEEMGKAGQPQFTSHHLTCPERAKRKRREVEDEGGQLPLL